MASSKLRLQHHCSLAQHLIRTLKDYLSESVLLLADSES